MVEELAHRPELLHVVSDLEQDPNKVDQQSLFRPDGCRVFSTVSSQVIQEGPPQRTEVPRAADRTVRRVRPTQSPTVPQRQHALSTGKGGVLTWSVTAADTNATISALITPHSLNWDTVIVLFPSGSRDLSGEELCWGDRLPAQYVPLEFSVFKVFTKWPD